MFLILWLDHKIKFINKRPGERFSSKSDTKKSFKDLGYKAKIDLKDYIRDFIKKNKKTK